MDEISKKDLLKETGISYGQLYRWKREGLIPEEWFVKRASFTGQETFFPRDRVLERIGLILEKKDDQSLEGIRKEIMGADDGEFGGLLDDIVMMAGQAEAPCSAVLFETNDGKHFILNVKDGSVLADSGVKVLSVLTEKELRGHLKIKANNEKQGG
jgi:DNA-binding transcriptional MerR regulator